MALWIRPTFKVVSIFQHHPINPIQNPNLPNKKKNTSTSNASCWSAMEAAGSDSDGREFKNAQEMWREQIGDGDEADNHKKTQWYRDGVAYWEGVEASVNGVLGGFGQVNDADIKGSEAFLNTLLHERFDGGGRNQHLVALDCGSGVGRITKNLLIRYFNEVDLLEPVSHFLDAARESLSQEYVASNMHKTTNFYCVPLQEFTPDAGRYDVIWIQWCIGHLTDDDFVSFFKRAKVGLKPGGFFVLKENIARNGFVLDNEDRSITRSELYFKDLFHQCGLHLGQLDVSYPTWTYSIKELKHILKVGIVIPLDCCSGGVAIQPIGVNLDQKGLPEELFAVKMFALTTDVPKKVHKTRSKAQANRPGIIK
ncbi:hypothetical protein COLO4_26880 [Corchorus olitorius]|uniref:Alpha N-terminal protein methyltransferase 1 n=1 Tax=Corchorus olitorius TaxID=93759 RepID=A0A1R3HUB9_9ROSI|nr:hypothetical protein COLO4_26880 [Corchorus olitorius]